MLVYEPDFGKIDLTRYYQAVQEQIDPAELTKYKAALDAEVAAINAAHPEPVAAPAPSGRFAKVLAAAGAGFLIGGPIGAGIGGGVVLYGTRKK